VSSRRWWAVSGALAVVSVIVFVPGLSHEFTWDDHGLIRTNENIQRPDRFVEALTTHFWNVSKEAVEANETYGHLYRPVVTLAYILQYRMFGDDARGYRIVSLALHLACTLLALFWLARRLNHGARPARLLAIGLAAAVFAVHPTRPESVSWISGSTELWMCLFVLLGAWAFDSERSWLAGLLLGVALFAKETALVVAPLVLVDRFLVHSRLERKASVALMLPVLVAVMARITVIDPHLPPGNLVGAVPRALASIGLYAGQVISPWNPTAFPGMRVYDCARGEVLPGLWWSAGVAVTGALVLLAVIATKRKAWRPALADGLWFTIPLLPVVNLVDLGSRNLTADRFLYLPMLGVCALLARGLLGLLEARPPLGRAAVAMLVVLVVGFGTLSALHTRVFASSSSFWEYEVERREDNLFALHAVGTARMKAGLHRTGLAFLTRARDVADETCVRVDRWRAARDLGWASAVVLDPDDEAAVTRLRNTFERLSSDGSFEHERPPRWSIQLTSDEVKELQDDPLHFVFPRALVEARAGNVARAREILAESGRYETFHPDLRALHLRLVAVDDTRHALMTLARTERVTDIESLTVVLATLHETLTRIDADAATKAALAKHALGFGASTPELDVVPLFERAVLEALRAYELNRPFDRGLLEEHADSMPELERFLRVAAARAEVRALDQSSSTP